MSSFVFNLEGLREVMKSPGTQRLLQAEGNKVAGIANASKPGYATDLHVAPYTAVCTVYPSDKTAGLDNYLHNTLLKATQCAGLDLTTHPKR